MGQHATGQDATTLKRSEDLRRGEILHIGGVGTFSISGFRKIGPGEVLIKLAWEELAVIAHRGQQWRVLTASIRNEASR